MAGVNKAILIGRIGRDPQIREFENGVKQISFSVATTESYRDSNGAWIDQTEWHNIVGYRYLAEKSFAKGDLVYVEGKIKTRKYTDQNGIEKYITEIIADKINIILRKGAGSVSGDSMQSSETPLPSGPASDNTVTDLPASEDATDDLPF